MPSEDAEGGQDRVNIDQLIEDPERLVSGVVAPDQPVEFVVVAVLGRHPDLEWLHIQTQNERKSRHFKEVA